MDNSILRFFEYAHLPERLQEVSKPFRDLADSLVNERLAGLADHDETEVALRKLLESKDAAVRAALGPVSRRPTKVTLTDHPVTLDGVSLAPDHIAAAGRSLAFDVSHPSSRA